MTDGRIAILMYHSLDLTGSVVSIRPQLFDDQMSALASHGWRGMSLCEAVAHRVACGGWPERAVVITFDDGFVNNVEFALPVLNQHKFTATLFAVSRCVGGHNNWGAPARLGSQRLASWPQLKTWCDAGNEVGAHTRHHRDVRSLAGDELAEEIVGSRDEIASRLGVAVESFAYPYGGVSSVAADMVQRSFRAACTTRLERAAAHSSHDLPRIDTYYLRDADSVVRTARGDRDGYLALRRWGRLMRNMWVRS